MKKIEMTSFGKARLQLLLQQEWWGSLALQLKVEERPDIDTAAVDGVTLFYNPEFFDGLTPEERIFVVAHEVSHCALCHMTRRGSRDVTLWNVACDFVINLELQQSGFTLCKNVLIDPKYAGMSAEQVYAKLEEQAAKNKKKYGDTASGKGGWDIGKVLDAPQPGQSSAKDANGQPTQIDPASADQRTPAEIEADWQIAVQQATMTAMKAGKCPGSAQRFIQKARENRVYWLDVVRKWISVIGDYSWTRPNRRYVGRGLYLPGTVKTKLSCMIFGVDTSGSIGSDMLEMAAGELEALFEMESRPDVIYVVYWDTRVQHVDEIEGELKFEARGGGGTTAQPLYDWIEKEGLTPDVLINFTDMQWSDKPKDPGYPVIFLVPEAYANAQVPFGEMAVIEKNRA